MNTFDALGWASARAICYSGFRAGQRPGEVYPDYEQVKEDLLLLAPHWTYLRMYDCNDHAQTTLEVIRKEKLGFKLLLGADVDAEISNPGCPWGGIHSEKKLVQNRKRNAARMEKLIELAAAYPDIIAFLSVGNEACVDWTDHAVDPAQILRYVQRVKDCALQPVTYCDNYVPWTGPLQAVAEAVDFISLHTYPVWEYKNIDEALDYTRENYASVAQAYPHKPVVITEAGWATASNGRGIDPENVNETFQKIYFERLMAWAESEGILTFFFEAFDEPWKGSPEPLEPEKHWGLFKVDRTPKAAMLNRYQRV